ncbi:hypothetical protein RR48_04873 [Papilio machaon]|uniref:Uncharacterized protein n=1 Tax=Papilio machaon TaxID=76193 RepID=A0A0N1IIS6_PAPMA|nr:hypothetical protein RR48_04873 [Papilio machaon]
MYRKASVLLTLISLSLASLLDGDFDITDGVKLVSIPVSNSIEDEGRSFDNSPLSRMAKFLQGHELHVKLPNIIEKDKITNLLAESLKVVDESYKNNNATGRGKGDGGGGMALLGLMFAKTVGAAGIGATGRGKGDGGGGMALLGLMFAKTVGAAGIGGLGLLTMKALAVSALALMLSAIVGVKKLASSDDHDDHQVIYAGHGHHRKRRDIDTPLPYRGWTQYKQENK